MSHMITQPFTAFLGPIGGPELVMILLVFGLLAIPAGIVIAIILFSNSRNKAPHPLPTPPPPLPNIESRLAEIDSLRAKNLISEAEHEEKRKQIIGEI